MSIEFIKWFKILSGDGSSDKLTPSEELLINRPKESLCEFLQKRREQMLDKEAEINEREYFKGLT